MILIAEIVHPGERHLRLNSALLSLAHRAFPDERIVMICEQKHANAMQAYGDIYCKRTEFRTFKSYNPGGVFFWPCKITGEWINILRVIRYARKHKPRLLIWTSLFPTGQWMLQLLSHIILQQQQQHVLLQGELEYFNQAMQKPTERILRFLLYRGLNHAPANTGFIVLADHIKEKMESLGLRSFNRIRILPHPFHYTSIERTGAPIPPQKWIAGTFGALQERKNTHYIFRLAAALRTEIETNHITFHAAGKCTPAMSHMRHNGLVTLHEPDRFLTQPAFEAIIAGFDLALFFYDNTAYTWCASGAIHEAIQLEIPVLAIRNHYFDWLVHTYGTICILFDDLLQMEHFIRELLRGLHTETLDQIRKNMRYFKLENTMEKQAQALKNVLRY